MRKRSPGQRVAVWFGLAGCTLSLAFWWLTSVIYINYNNPSFGFGACDGVLYVWAGDRLGVSNPYGEFVVESPIPNVWLEVWPRIARDSNGYMVACMQSWWVFLTIATVTGFLWWRNRSFPPGHCQKCGYNLTGNVSGVCSECGEPTRAIGDAVSLSHGGMSV